MDDALRLDDRDRLAFPLQERGCGEACDPGADHAHVDVDVALESRDSPSPVSSAPRRTGSAARPRSRKPTVPAVILDNGVIHTLDPSMPTARALAIAGERVAGGVGTHETALASPERVDLGGRCVRAGLQRRARALPDVGGRSA